jgi:hypothetical protein
MTLASLEDQVEAASFSEGILDRGAACAGTGGDGVDMQGADAMMAHLVRDDSEGGHLALGEPGGEGRGLSGARMSIKASLDRRREEDRARADRNRLPSEPRRGSLAPSETRPFLLLWSSCFVWLTWLFSVCETFPS